MSEMLANQYFISERYFEALEEYSNLPREKQNNLLIKQKMIISAALDENFEKALFLLKDIIVGNPVFLKGIELSNDECPCREIMAKLENQIEAKHDFDDKKKMQIAILNFFPERDKAIEYFKNLLCSKYSEMVKLFLQSVTKSNNNLRS